jgi:hypothetical protein
MRKTAICPSLIALKIPYVIGIRVIVIAAREDAEPARSDRRSIASVIGANMILAPHRVVLEHRREPTVSQPQLHLVAPNVNMLMETQMCRIVTLANVLSIASANGANMILAPHRVVLESRREPTVSQPQPHMVAMPLPVKLMIKLQRRSLVTLANAPAN